MNYFFHADAETEHLETVVFFESRRPGLGARYLTAFERAMAQVVEAPQRYPVIREPDLRRIMLNRFPLHIIYRERPQAIQVLAVAHVRRRPGYWLGRL